MKAFLDQFAAILGAATVTVLLMSVCHEFGYFTLIGRHFQTLLSTTDYLANGVVFLPLAIFFAYGVQWSELELEPRPTRDWKKWRSWIWPTLIGLFFIFIAVTTPWPPYAFNMMYLMAVVIFAWSKIWPLVYRPVTSLGDDLNSVYRNTIRVGPPLAILLFLWGWINASTDLVRVDDPYLVKVKNQGTGELRIFLRSFDKGLLLRNPLSGRIEFRRWDDIVSLEKQSTRRSDSFACWAYDWCPDKKREPTP